MRKSKTVLVLAAGSLGDALLTLPALRYLSAGNEATVAGTSPYNSLGAGLLGLQRVIPLDPLLQILYSTGDDSSQRDFWRAFDEIFVFFKDKDAAILEKLAALSGAQVRFPSKPFSEFLQEGRWAAEYWLETAASEPVPYDSPYRQTKLKMDEKFQARGRELLAELPLKNPFVIHPGSGSRAKNAPLDFFRTAAERAVKESKKEVLVIWGEAEEKNLGDIRRSFEGIEGVRVLPQILPLADLAAVLSQCSAYLGNDSGVTHLAAACGLRTFAIFQTTDARVWGPNEAVIWAALQSLHLSKK